jgi:hypothetical protein
MAYVYKHKRLDTGNIFYIGIGKDIKGKYKRAFSKQKRNNFWKNIISKTDYLVEIIKDDISWGEACKIEKELILLYGRRDMGLGTLCNQTDGGDGNIGWSDDARKKISLLSSKPVMQYDKSGNFIKEWESAKEAANKFFGKKSGADINKCCKKDSKVKSVFGYVWRYKNEEEWFEPLYKNLLQDKEFIKQRTDNTNYSKIRKPVVQYDKNGFFIKKWESSSEAGNNLKIPIASISDCCNEKSKSAGGYQWRFYIDDSLNNIEPLLYDYKNNKNRKKPILQYDIDGNFIKEWASAKDIEIKKGYFATNITACCRGKVKTLHNYIWKYKNK